MRSKFPLEFGSTMEKGNSKINTYPVILTAECLELRLRHKILKICYWKPASGMNRNKNLKTGKVKSENSVCNPNTAVHTIKSRKYSKFQASEKSDTKASFFFSEIYENPREISKKVSNRMRKKGTNHERDQSQEKHKQRW